MQQNKNNPPTPDVPITFGICVGPDYNQEWLLNCINSIRAQNIPKYEIILVFNTGSQVPNEIKNDAGLLDLVIATTDGWLPQKKNLIARNADHDVLCIVHDYYCFDDNWYEGFIEYNASSIKNFRHWDLLNCFVQRAEDGERGPDWVINPFYLQKFLAEPKNQDIFRDLQKRFPTENHPMYVVGLSPFESRFVDIQYASGGYIMCRKDVLTSFPLNENLAPGSAEDIEWYERVKASKKYKLRFNPFSIVYLQKPNKWRVFPFPPEYLPRLLDAVQGGFFNDASV